MYVAVSNMRCEQDGQTLLWFGSKNPHTIYMIIFLINTAHHEVLLLILWRRIFLGKLVVAQLVRKFLAFYGV